MINGLKVTQIPLVKFQLESHRKKLQSISGKKFSLINHSLPQQQYDSFLKDSQTQSFSQKYSTSLSLSRQKFISGLSPSEKQRLQKKKQNHLKSVSYHKLKKQLSIEHQNQIIYQKLLRIQKRKDVNNPAPSLLIQTSKSQQKISKRQKKKGKDFVYRKKQSLAIEATNVQIGKRIMNQTGYYNHQKDKQQFNKTRQILNRLNKFNTVQRLMKSPKRNKTLPSKLPKIKLSKSSDNQVQVA